MIKFSEGLPVDQVLYIFWARLSGKENVALKGLLKVRAVPQ